MAYKQLILFFSMLNAGSTIVCHCSYTATEKWKEIVLHVKTKIFSVWWLELSSFTFYKGKYIPKTANKVCLIENKLGKYMPETIWNTLYMHLVIFENKFRLLQIKVFYWMSVWTIAFQWQVTFFISWLINDEWLWVKELNLDFNFWCFSQTSLLTPPTNLSYTFIQVSTMVIFDS